MIDLIEPFPVEHYSLLCDWLGEFPRNNFEDGNPWSLDELRKSMADRYAIGHRVIEVLSDDRPVGVIGYQQIAFDIGTFRGICFTRSTHGTGIPLRAVQDFLQALFDGHTKQVVAQCFSDNARVRVFLRKLGAVDVVVTRGRLTRGLTEVSISSDDFVRTINRPIRDTERPVPSKALPSFAR